MEAQPAVRARRQLSRQRASSKLRLKPEIKWHGRALMLKQNVETLQQT